MKILLVYFSRTGNTKKVAYFLAKKLNAKVEQIKDNTDRQGIKGYLISTFQALLGRRVLLKKPVYQPKKFDLIVIGTPVWDWQIAPPVATYLDFYRTYFKKLAFFCTFKTSGAFIVLQKMVKLTGKKPVANLAIKASEFKNRQALAKMLNFCQTIFLRT